MPYIERAAIPVRVPHKPQRSKHTLLSEFKRPQIVVKSADEIARDKADYLQIVASFAMEGHEPDDFGKIVTMERIRGELTEQQAKQILLEMLPDETKRIQQKIFRLKALGLSWKDL